MGGKRLSIENIWWLAIIINGLFTGLGTALGNYLANKHLIKKIEHIEEKIKKNFGGKNGSI
jgi:uncharacterized protein YneF (UPF0154 family)